MQICIVVQLWRRNRDRRMTLKTILVTGTVGVGKSSVLVEIGEELELAAVPYAILDLDWLAWLRPSNGSGASVQRVLVENLGHVTHTFRGAGVELLVLARAVRRIHEVEAIRDAVGPGSFTVVRLTASPDVIASRLGARDNGAQLASHLLEAEGFAADAESAGIGDLVISTDDRTVGALALEVLERAGWRESVS
jgi:adenylylsulfate kinase-like enzyme